MNLRVNIELRGAVDLTARKLLNNCELGEIIELLAKNEIKLLREKHYGEMQYMIQEFYETVKIPYTGDNNFSSEFDLDRICPVLKQGEAKTSLDEKEWIIEVNNDDVKEMFIPSLRGLFDLYPYNLKILANVRPYLCELAHILIPSEPTAAVVRGAVIFGLRMNPSFCNIQVLSFKPIIKNRVLKYTYGVKVFLFLVWLKDVENCFEEVVEHLGELLVDPPDIDLGLDRRVRFSLCFGEEEIKAST
ncbi:23125_t:CDS:2, partial [Gigaspora rosea]